MDINKKTFYTITFGEFISNVGDRFQKIAFPILIYQEFHSSFAMGGMVIIELLPQFLLGFVMGYLLDNFNKKEALFIKKILLILNFNINTPARAGEINFEIVRTP